MDIKELIKRNHEWAENIANTDPDFFPTLAAQQKPEFLWIGCSDSRVPANQVVDLDPGEVFVHRNVSNMVIHTDMNMLSVVQFAVEILEVKHIIIVGHYGCGGVRAAMEQGENGLIDNWLLDIKDTIYHHRKALADITDYEEKVDRVCELNVIQQVYNLSHTNIVQKAWRNNKRLQIHGWCYGLNNGKVKDLEVTVDSAEKLKDIYRYKVES